MFHLPLWANSLPSRVFSSKHWQSKALWRTMSNIASYEGPKFTELKDASEDSTKFATRFRVISYNILAQAYVKSINFPHSPPPCLRWKARSQAILDRLLSLNADFLCIQELDEYENFYKAQLDNHGYGSLYVKRNGKKRDGCGIFYRRNRIQLTFDETINYNDLVPSGENGLMSTMASSDLHAYSLESGKAMASEETAAENTCGDRGDPNDPAVRLKRDCVGVIGAFRFANDPHNLIIVANTHIYWDPDWADVKLAQAKYLSCLLVEFRSKVARQFQCIPPIIICGDFNSTPGDEVYNYLTAGSEGNLLGTSVSEASSVSVLPLHNLPVVTNKCRTMTVDKLPTKCPLSLHSLYAFVRSEPAFTNCTPDFTGTLDYVFFSPSSHLKPLSLLELPAPDAPDVIGGLPNYNHPSDHLPIGADFSLSN